MNNHLFCIKRFKPFIKYNNEVSSHFNYKHHSLENFKVCVFKDNLEDDAERKLAESNLINLTKFE